MDEETLTVWLDTALLMLGSFVLMAVLMMTVMNPPAKAEKEGETAPGNVIVEIEWADSVDADVDLWVKAPGDASVGYSNKGGRVFNLLRDDLGRTQDLTDYNHESAYTRGSPAGEYIVNVHLYRGAGVTYPVKVKVVVSGNQGTSKSVVQLAMTIVELLKPNQEITALRFSLDKDGHLVPGSMNSIFKGLRVAASQ